MKVSEYLRQYQLTGEVPDDGGDSLLNFYAGWLIGAARKSRAVTDFNGAREMAIRVAEEIESRVRE